MNSDEDTRQVALGRVGCPIRRPRDHRSLASPPGFSQRATSFIASQCQGIHQMPFICSIQSTVGTPKGGTTTPGTPPRTAANPKRKPQPSPHQYYRPDRQPRSHGPCPAYGVFSMKTLFGRSPHTAFHAAGRAVRLGHIHKFASPNQSTPARSFARGATNRARPKCPGKTQSSPNAIGSQARSQTPDPFQPLIAVIGSVEVNGIEPMTSCLQSRRSPN